MGANRERAEQLNSLTYDYRYSDAERIDAIERAIDAAVAEAVADELLSVRKKLDDLGYINAGQHVKAHLDVIRSVKR